MDFNEWDQDETLVGGFGSAVTAASDGTKSIAQSNGLQVGDVWARNVVTGADNVLETSLYSALAVPNVGSALAETALGKAGLLPPAGSGAQYYNTSQGNAGQVSMPPAQVTVVNHTYLDGQIVDTKIDTKITQNNNALADIIYGAKG
jgi:hypothetical protein